MIDDEYGSLEFPDLTEEDLKAIDALTERPARVPIEIEPVLYTSRSVASPPPMPPFRPIQRSLYDIFRRKRNFLSVTDLVAPTWCEVQFDYGLRGKRRLPPALRPDKITTKDGKEIIVNKAIDLANDKIMRKGEAVHKTLEEEIHPVRVHIQATTKEEEMGLRMLNMLSGLKALVELNCCRELPVMGFLHDHYVVGIIDEILRTPIEASHASNGKGPSTPKGKKSKKPETPSTQTKIFSFFTASPKSPKSPTTSTWVKTHNLHVRDTKTRVSASLPSESKSLSSRIQLMVYKRLLDPLLSVTPPFDFSTLWSALGLDTNATFSESFVSNVVNLAVNNNLNSSAVGARSLADFEEAWRIAVREVGADVTESGLELVYRLQPGRGRRRVRRKANGESPVSLNESIPESEDSLEHAMLASMEFIGSMPGAFGGMSDRSFLASADDQVLAMVLKDSLATAGLLSEQTEDGSSTSEETGLQAAIRMSLDFVNTQLPEGVTSLRTAGSIGIPPTDLPVLNGVTMPPSNDEQSPPAVEEDAATEDAATSEARILGSHHFKYDADVLDAHLSDVLKMWHGQRPLRGVSLENVDRCWACPYQNGCEWRESKATEFAARASVERPGL